jgi:hypothetical protein
VVAEPHAAAQLHKAFAQPAPIQIGTVAEHAAVGQVLVDGVLLVVFARDSLDIQSTLGQAAQVEQCGFQIRGCSGRAARPGR